MGSKASLKEVPRPSRALCCQNYIIGITQAVQFKVSNTVPISPPVTAAKGGSLIIQNTQVFHKE